MYSLVFDYICNCKFDENTPKKNIYDTIIMCFGHVYCLNVDCLMGVLLQNAIHLHIAMLKTNRNLTRNIEMLINIMNTDIHISLESSMLHRHFGWDASLHSVV